MFRSRLKNLLLQNLIPHIDPKIQKLKVIVLVSHIHNAKVQAKMNPVNFYHFFGKENSAGVFHHLPTSFESVKLITLKMMLVFSSVEFGVKIGKAVYGGLESTLKEYEFGDSTLNQILASAENEGRRLDYIEGRLDVILASRVKGKDEEVGKRKDGGKGKEEEGGKEEKVKDEEDDNDDGNGTSNSNGGNGKGNHGNGKGNDGNGKGNHGNGDSDGKGNGWNDIGVENPPFTFDPLDLI